MFFLSSSLFVGLGPIFLLDKSGLEAIKLFILKTTEHENPAHNVKMPTIVGILTFISRKNATFECFKWGKMQFFSTLRSMSS